MNFDVNNVVKKLKKLESTLKNKIESGSLYGEVKRFANGQAHALSQRVKSSKDAKKLMGIIQQRRKQIEKIAAEIPGEVKVVRSYVKSQRKELEKLGNELLKRARNGEFNADTLRSALQKATTKKSVATSGKRAGTTKKAAKKRSKR